MTWTFAQLKAAYQALSPTPATLADAVTTLNAQTSSTTVDVPASSVRDYLLTTGEWGGLMVAIQSGTTATAEVQGIIHSLKTLVETGATVQATIGAVQTAVSGWLSTLETAGLISANTVLALEAMWTATLPVWNPPVEVANLQTAGV